MSVKIKTHYFVVSAAVAMLLLSAASVRAQSVTSGTALSIRQPENHVESTANQSNPDVAELKKKVEQLQLLVE